MRKWAFANANYFQSTSILTRLRLYERRNRKKKTTAATAHRVIIACSYTNRFALSLSLSLQYSNLNQFRCKCHSAPHLIDYRKLKMHTHTIFFLHIFSLLTFRLWTILKTFRTIFYQFSHHKLLISIFQ